MSPDRYLNGILVRPISDHQMYFCMMNEIYVKPLTKQKYIKIDVCNQASLENFRKEIADADIYDKLHGYLSTDPNVNYEMLSFFLNGQKSAYSKKN